MKIKVKYQDLGLIDYKQCWDYQTRLFNDIVNFKAGNKRLPPPSDYLIFCEHPHVYTLGKSGSQSNLLIDFLKLKNINATYYHIDRGGDITYHGPGQIVGYPVLDLEKFNLGIKKYIWSLEQAVILTLDEYDIKAGRLEGATGVWLGNNENKNLRKICAIGVRTSRFVSMHGFAFNVNTDLSYFNYINPCGFTDKSVTSLQKELSAKMDFDEVKNKLKLSIKRVFGMELK